MNCQLLRDVFVRWLRQSIRTPVTVLLLLAQTGFAQQGRAPSSPPQMRHSFLAQRQSVFPAGSLASQEPPLPTPFSPPIDSVPQPPSALVPQPSMVSPQSMVPPIPDGIIQDSSFVPFTVPGMTPGHPGPGTSGADPNERRWSFNFQGAPWLTVLRTFAKEAGFALQISAEPDGEFTYFDENTYTATEVLDLFNDYLMTNGRILVRDGNRLTLTNATSDIPGNMIPFVPIHLIDSLGRNELASVAIPLRNTDPALAVEEIRQLQSQLGQVKALTNSGRVIVTDTGSYLRRMRDLLLGSGVAAGDGQAYVYQLKHAQAEDVAKAVTDFLSHNGGMVAADGSTMGGGGSSSSQRVVAEKTTNSLLVRGTTEEMGTIQRLIDELDRAPREVLVQALLVEVELGNTNELGVELGFQDSVLFDRGVVDKLVTVSQTTTAPNGTQTTNQNIISQTSAPGFQFNNQPLGSNIAASPGRVAPQGLSNLGVGRVNGDLGFGGLVLSAGSESVNLLLRALDAHFNIDVLSRPQVRAVENHEAFIQIGQQVPVVDGVAITPVGTANPIIRQDQAGIILKVTPRISPDGRVQLAVNAEKSAFNLTPGTGVPIFTDATNGNVIEAPIRDITTADTTVSIQSGQTIVLGGMITNDQTVVVRKVPWLGDIPFIGRLFRYDLSRHKRKELLVFLTPTVLENDGHSEFLKSRESGLIKMPAEAFSFGDNLTGIYGGSNGSIYGPSEQSQPLNEATDTSSKGSLFPESGSRVRPASHSRVMPADENFRPAAIPAAGHSGSLRQVSLSGSTLNNSGSQTSSLSEEPVKKKSFWGRSPHFRGFGGSKKNEPEQPRSTARPQNANGDDGQQREFPRAQPSPEVLPYQQSRYPAVRR